MCVPTLLRPQPSEVISTADTITITLKITEEGGWALGGGRNVSFEIPVKKTTMWEYIVLGMWFKEHNQRDRKGIGRRLFLCYNSWLRSEVLYNALNLICNCCHLFHLSKTCDSYFIDIKSLSKAFFFRVQLLNVFRGPVQIFNCPQLRNTFSGKGIAFSKGR